ncbi:MAG: TIM barrel protein [Reichenbachiella sp.]|uniref:TIM barrel protein n=1 Tax=Reichenbachiella sp. TaxID=2184521 RepID=UPI002966C488|nr:TIM barrel protein [Reichenbachiella sp.]MDW3212189.1 TIM barrel protein [Reichenbachiella sp.]
MIKIANAPCSWGILEFGLEGKTSPYTQVLDEIRETGYEGTELGDWGFLPTQPYKLFQDLSERNLDLLGAFVPVNLRNADSHVAGISYALKIAGLMYYAGYENARIVLADDNGTVDARVKNAGRITPTMGLNYKEWKVFAEGANQIAYAVKEAFGFETVFHHHCAGFVETPEEVEMLIEHTDENLVGLCLDTGHYHFGGGDPIDALKKYKDRIWHVHFKDFDPVVAEQARINKWDYFTSVKHGIFCELGKGAVDFKGVLAELEKQNYTGWAVVEQDVLPGMGDPKFCARANRDYLKGIGL